MQLDHAYANEVENSAFNAGTHAAGLHTAGLCVRQVNTKAQF